MSTEEKTRAAPVVYMSPELGFVRKGRKSSARLLMCSAVRERSSFTFAVDSACSETGGPGINSTVEPVKGNISGRKRRKSAAHAHL